MTPALLLLVLSAAPRADALTQAELDDVVANRAAAFEACAQPKLQGAAVLVVQLAPSGAVTAVKTKRDSKPPTADCVSQVLKGVSFPPRAAGASLRLAWKGATPPAPPRVAAGDPAGLSLEALKAVQRAHAADVARCRYRAREDGTGPRRYQSRVVVGPSGAVLDGESNDKSACATAAARGWRFPQARARTSATLTWLVTARPGEQAPGADAAAVVLSEVDAWPLTARDDTYGKALLKQAPALAACAAELNGGAASVDALWRLGADGRLEVVSVTASNESATLAGCVVQRSRGFSFPAGAVPTPKLLAHAIVFDGATVTVHDAPPPPGLDKDVIRGVIHEHLDEVKSCHETVVQEGPELEGKLVLALRIAPTGDVAEAKIQQDTLGSSPVAKCLTQRARAWKFPAPNGGVEVETTYPFVFKMAKR